MPTRRRDKFLERQRWPGRVSPPWLGHHRYIFGLILTPCFLGRKLVAAGTQIFIQFIAMSHKFRQNRTKQI